MLHVNHQNCDNYGNGRFDGCNGDFGDVKGLLVAAASASMISEDSSVNLDCLLLPPKTQVSRCLFSGVDAISAADQPSVSMSCVTKPGGAGTLSSGSSGYLLISMRHQMAQPISVAKVNGIAVAQ